MEKPGKIHITFRIGFPLRKTEVKGIKMGYTRPIFSKSQVNMANFIFAFNY